MGLFFMSVGMSIDPLEMRTPALLLGSVAGLFVLKAVIVAAVMRVGGCRSARQSRGLPLGQGGRIPRSSRSVALSLGLLPEQTGWSLLGRPVDVRGAAGGRARPARGRASISPRRRRRSPTRRSCPT